MSLDGVNHRVLVIYSGSAVDRELYEEILSHLRAPTRAARIEVWSPDEIEPGTDRRREVAQAIARATVALVLVSPDLMRSNPLLDAAITDLRALHDLKVLRMIPVVIRSCFWEEHPWLGTLRPLPKDGRSIASLSKERDERDQTLKELAKEVIALVTEALFQIAAEPSAPPAAQDWKAGGTSFEEAATVAEPSTVSDAKGTSLDDADSEQLGLAGLMARDLAAQFRSNPCPEHHEPARPVVTGQDVAASLSVVCCCAPYADAVRQGLFRASVHVAVRSRDHLQDAPAVFDPHQPGSGCLEDVLPEGRVRWAGLEDDVEITETQWYGPSLLRVHCRDGAGRARVEFLDRTCEASLDIIERGSFFYALRRHPSGVPRLFTDRAELFRTLRELHTERTLPSMVDAYLGDTAWRLSTRATTVHLVRANSDTVEDATSKDVDSEILWEVFDGASSVDDAFWRLERDSKPHRLKVAIALDPEVDAQLYEGFRRNAQTSRINVQLRASDLMLADRFRQTVKRIARELDRLPGRDSSDRLELVDLGLEPDQPCWGVVPDIPYGYSGLKGPGSEIADPVFFLDLLNAGTREARIYAAYIDVRLRHIKPHGFPEPRLLRPITTVDLPLNNGMQEYTEVRLHEPVLVPPGSHVRIQIRLVDAGYTWRGVVDWGLLYGEERRLRVPSLSIFL